MVVSRVDVINGVGSGLSAKVAYAFVAAKHDLAASVPVFGESGFAGGAVPCGALVLSAAAVFFGVLVTSGFKARCWCVWHLFAPGVVVPAVSRAVTHGRQLVYCSSCSLAMLSRSSPNALRTCSMM